MSRPPMTEEERQRIANDERRRSDEARIARMGGPMEEREARVRRLLAILARASEAVAALEAEGLRLADVTTSPADFEAAKRLMLGIVRPLSRELEAAGVLRPPPGTDRRQQSLGLLTDAGAVPRAKP